MEDYFVIKNTKDNKFFAIVEIDKKKDEGRIDFVGFGAAMPLNSIQADQVMYQLSITHPAIKLAKEKIDNNLARVMSNKFNIDEILVKEQLEKHNSSLAERFSDKIESFFSFAKSKNPDFSKLPINAATSNLINVGLSQISDVEYSSYSKRLENILGANKNDKSYFRMYSILIEVGLKSMRKDLLLK